VTVLAVIALFAYLIRGADVALFNTKGFIADRQRNFIIFTMLLSMTVIIPVFTLLFVFAYKYRESKPRGKYTPDTDHNLLAEIIWWGVPCCLILLLGIITWNSAHTLDPYRPLVSDKKPISVQVIALDWKWLFIYPEQNIASVNFLQFPVNRPVNFTITADAPMNSFWIPSLGGQIYAMPGMSTKLHLEAHTAGEYKGVSANISGEGFAGMKFIAKASSEDEFTAWVKQARHADKPLSHDIYDKLARPSSNNPRAVYSSVAPDLYDTVIMKYMAPADDQSATPTNKQEAHAL
jgi:cytochrome o ubiquinol oxidase subunit 2